MSVMHEPYHSRSLQTETPSQRMHVFWQSHRLQHLWTEHPAISNLDPFFKSRVECKDFQGWLSKLLLQSTQNWGVRYLGIRVVCRLEP